MHLIKTLTNKLHYPIVVFVIIILLSFYFSEFDHTTLPPLNSRERNGSVATSNNNNNNSISSDVEKMKNSDQYQTVSFIMNDVTQQKENWVSET